MTFFTNFDIRNGIEDAYFTEARTGILVDVCKMLKDSELAERVKEKLNQEPDVMTLPLYEMNDFGEMHKAEE